MNISSIKNKNSVLSGVATIILASILSEAGEETGQRRILEITVRGPLTESFAIETLFLESPDAKITVRQFRPLVEKLDPERPKLEMFAFELAEIWEGDRRVVRYENDPVENRIGPRPGERRELEILVGQLWNRGNHEERRGNELYVVTISQQQSGT
ncbi:MAG: hypothetical protein AAGH89_18000 [Verrucomicrobiota bacterium]